MLGALERKRMIANIFYLSRGGSHAIINWLCQHFDDYLYLNDIQNKVARGTEQRGSPINIFFGYEDRYIENSYEFPYFEYGTQLQTMKTEIRTIYLLRDPLNWMASSIHLSNKWTRQDMSPVEHINLYKSYLNNNQYYMINFNKWFTSYKYRRQIEQDLNLGLSDNGLNSVLHYGSGSSFDGRKYNGKAQQMNVLNRWGSHKKHELMQLILQDDELMHACKTTFEMNI